jgi:hypothetical protein
MMMHENALAAFESLHRGAGLLDGADRLVPEHQWRLALDIPGHDIARADPARTRANQHIAGTNLRPRTFLNADIAEIV